MNLSTTVSLDELVQELPFSVQLEVRDFVEFLKTKYVVNKAKGQYLRQDWAGELSQYREQYTSLELQKKALEWRNS